MARPHVRTRKALHAVTGFFSCALVAGAAAGAAAVVTVATDPPGPGETRTVVSCDPSPLHVTEAFLHATQWDLVGLTPTARTVVRIVEPLDAPRPRGLFEGAHVRAARIVTFDVAADGSSMAPRAEEYLHVDLDRPFPDRWNVVAWSAPARRGDGLRTLLDPGTLPDRLALGSAFTRRMLDHAPEGRSAPVLRTEHVDVVGEGIVITFAGPREALLLRVRELDDRAPFHVAGPEDGRRLSYRWVANHQGEVAVVVGPEGSWDPYFGVPSSIAVLEQSDANQGITIEKAKMPLGPGELFLAQYYMPAPAGSRPLTDIDNPTWSSSNAMIGDVVTRTDPNTGQSLAETWDFVDPASDPLVNGGVSYTNFTQDCFVQVRTDSAGLACPTSYSTFQAGSGPDYTWQWYLKFDYWSRAPAGRLSRDAYRVNEKTNAMDLTVISQGETPASYGASRACFTSYCDGTTAGTNRLMRFLNFNNPAGFMQMGDAWSSVGGTGCGATSGAWVWENEGTTCATSADGQAANTCNGVSFAFRIVEDGYFRSPTGLIGPALLMEHRTTMTTGAFGICGLGASQYSYDYWWISEKYGILARVGSPNGASCPTLPFTTTDGAFVSVGLFPPYQVTGEGCLGTARVNWTLPKLADASRFIDGYKVYWGPTPGSKANASAVLPDTQTTYDITTALTSPTYVSVVSTYAYADPDLGQLSYESPLSYNVSVTPLSAGSFVVGNTMTAGKSGGTNLAFAWGAVSGADAYRLKRGTSPNPATHVVYADGLATPSYTTTDGSGANGTTYYYESFALDGCGNESQN